VKRVVLTLLLAVAPLGATALAAGDPVAGKTVFGKCSQCHQVGPNAQNATGPVLNGIVGQKAGVVPGYNFSDAMKNSGITWDEATLAAYLKSPRKVVPGNKMSFVGLPKDDDIANVIAYLETFDISGNTVTPGAAAPAATAPANTAPAQ
jgi:cytochrome c